MELTKKILFILHIPPPVHGSSIVGSQIVNSSLIRSNFEIDYVNLSTSNSIAEIGGWNLKKTTQYFKILYSIIIRVIKNNYDLIYLAPTVSSKGFYKDFLVVLLLKIFNKKIVYHLHNKGVSKNNYFINKLLYKFFFKNVDIILLSRLLYEDISAYVFENRIYICPNGIEFIPELDKKLNRKLKNKNLTILFLSNLIESKGYLVLLDACKILNDNGLNFKCLFVGGEGDLTSSQFSDLIKSYGLQDKVFYLGKKYGEEKHNIFLNADIFAFPTFYENETFGLVNIEAMQYGLPVITTSEGGIPDIIQDKKTGYIIKKRDSVELAEKLTLLLKNDNLRIKFGQKGRERFLNKYRLEIFEKKLIKILNELS